MNEVNLYLPHWTKAHHILRGQKKNVSEQYALYVYIKIQKYFVWMFNKLMDSC